MSVRCMRSAYWRPTSLLVRFLSHRPSDGGYTQGQTFGKDQREYFYFIDHMGQLFLDDTKIKNFTSCFKDKEFLVFFYNRLRVNRTGRYEEIFPYLSLCGRERNFIRCDDLPIVFCAIQQDPDGRDVITYGNAGDKLKTVFEPQELTMLPNSWPEKHSRGKPGRVYYPTEEKFGSVGLVRSTIALELSDDFVWGNGLKEPPTHLKWRGAKVELTGSVLEFLEEEG